MKAKGAAPFDLLSAGSFGAQATAGLAWPIYL